MGKHTALALWLCVLSAVCDFDGVIALGESDPPPAGVAAGAALAALVTFAGAAMVWRGRRGGAALVVASRLTSMLVFGVPAYFIGAPGWVYAMAGAGIVLGVAGLGLMWTSRRQVAGAA